MRSVMVKVSGKPTPGDLVMLSYHGSRGGRSTAKYLVKGEIKRIVDDKLVVDRADSIEDVVTGIAASINAGYPHSEWSPEIFKASVDGTLIIIACGDGTAGVRFSSDVEGAGTEKLTIKELDA